MEEETADRIAVIKPVVRERVAAVVSRRPVELSGHPRASRKLAEHVLHVLTCAVSCGMCALLASGDVLFLHLRAPSGEALAGSV